MRIKNRYQKQKSYFRTIQVLLLVITKNSQTMNNYFLFNLAE
jgi:hypothetical protein